MRTRYDAVIGDINYRRVNDNATITIITHALGTNTLTDGLMDGRHWEIHLPLRPEGFPYKEAEQHMRTMLPTDTGINHTQNHASTARNTTQGPLTQPHMKSFMRQVVTLDTHLQVN